MKIKHFNIAKNNYKKFMKNSTTNLNNYFIK